MTEALRAYLLSITASSALLSLIHAILPKGNVRRVADFVGGLLVVLSVLSPVAKLDYSDFARTLSGLQMNAEEMRTGIEVSNRELMTRIIKERCESYILDKANQMELELQVEVYISEGTDYPYPEAISLQGAVTTAQRNKLQRILEEEFGIPAEQQEWIS